ncbi:unnamed protein product [Polarella glacialis]|uniref:Uncharacterized protein n=1 Tax=Polarella glacialis TaxID=89957 RepID=A0A813KMH3_POLGL|nr:unnamed protein product [Polarella glacialis]
MILRLSSSGVVCPARAPCVPLAMEVSASQRGPPVPRTIRIADVVKALEIAAERLGDAERSCATLRTWAAAGRVTPAGQLLTPDAVAKGIELWMSAKASPSQSLPPSGKEAKETACPDAKADTAARQPPTPLSAKRCRAPSRDAAAAPAAAPTAEAVADVPDVASSGTDPVAKKQRSGKPTKADREAGKPTYADRVQERKEQELRMQELTERRFEEVMLEIRGHMEEILRRTGPAALKEFQAAPAGCDHRELYMRLVHARQEADVRAPEELNAQLMAHQLEGLEWLTSLYVNNLHGILADEMGLGKTIQSLSLLLFIQERKGNPGPHLIVAPKSCLSNWEAEFKRFAPGFSVHTLTGNQESRETELGELRKSIAEKRPVACLTNYEQVYRNEWLAKNEWQLVIVDEGHRLKNPETVLHTAMAQLKCRMRLLLTGTPFQNSLSELWALLHYLLPDLFTHMMDFKAWFAQPFKGAEVNEFDMQLNPQQEQQVIAQMHSLLAPFLLQRLKSEALGDSLPPKVEVHVRVPLSAWQQAAYTDLEKRTIRLLGDDQSVTSEQVNNALMQLRKTALHPYLFQESYKRDDNLFRVSGKVEALDRVLSKLLKFGHKVLIFSQFTSVLDILEAFLQFRKITSVRLDGQVPHEERRARMARFQSDPKVSVFLLSARAGGLGLNLQAADTVILFDLDWNPQNDKQAIARVHRVGQTREVRVIRLVTDSAVERHMEQRCQEKLEMEEKIMGAGMFRKQANAEQRRESLRAMLGLGELPSGPASASASASESCLTSPEELSQQLARSDKERKAFAEMDAALLKPKRGAAKDAPLLVRCGRLMSSSEVPQGFTVRADED